MIKGIYKKVVNEVWEVLDGTVIIEKNFWEAEKLKEVKYFIVDEGDIRISNLKEVNEIKRTKEYNYRGTFLKYKKLIGIKIMFGA